MLDKETPYSKDNLDQLYKLFRTVGGFNDELQQLIYDALRLYIDPNHYRPIANCNCTMSYANSFNKLRDWVSMNADKFNITNEPVPTNDTKPGKKK